MEGEEGPSPNNWHPGISLLIHVLNGYFILAKRKKNPIYLLNFIFIYFIYIFVYINLSWFCHALIDSLI